MKTKKAVITVLTVALLVSAAIIVGCTNDSDGFTYKYAEETFKIPPGKGVLKIKFADSNGRTILPVAPDTTALEGYTYDLLIKKGSGPGETTPVNLTNQSYDSFTSTIPAIGTNRVIDLAPGTDYNISLTAKSGGTGIGSYTGSFSISSGQSTNVSAVLKPYDDAGQGTFTYNITAAANGTTTLDIFENGSSTSIGDSYYGADHGETEDFPLTVAIGTPESATITLDSGYYLVKITASGTNTQTIQYIHALHIYQGMNSTLPPLDLSGTTLAVDRFTVTYHLPEVDTLGFYTDGGTDTVYYANLITKKGSGPTAGQPVFSTNTFGGWWTTDDYEAGTLINLDAYRVTGNVHLYGKSDPPGGGDGSLTIAISFPINEQALVTGTTTITKTALVNGTNLVLTAPDDVEDIEWSIGGDTIGAPHLSDDGGTNNVLTINNSATFLKYLVSSSFVVNFVGTKDDQLYSAAITISLSGSLP